MPPDDEATEDGPAPWSDCIVCATHKTDDFMSARKMKPWIFGRATHAGNRPEMITKHHDDRWTSLIEKWSPTISTEQKWYGKRGRPAKRWEDGTTTISQTTRPAHYSTKRLGMGLHGNRLRGCQRPSTNKTQPSKQRPNKLYKQRAETTDGTQGHQRTRPTTTTHLSPS